MSLHHGTKSRGPRGSAGSPDWMQAHSPTPPRTRRGRRSELGADDRRRAALPLITIGRQRVRDGSDGGQGARAHA